MIPKDADQPADEHIRLAGKPEAKGDLVARGFLQVLQDGPAIAIPAEESGRVQLSQWLTDPNTRTGALAARVLANRIWHHLLGRGIVRTVDNFGRTGELPRQSNVAGLSCWRTDSSSLVHEVADS